MPKIKASMKDVSTDFSPIEPGVYKLEVQSVEEHEDEQTGRIHYEIQSKIVAAEDGGNEDDVGRNFRDRIHIHKKDGELNQMGLAQLKRYFEVTVGEDRANADDADTDELVNQQFLGQLTIRKFTQEDNLTGEKVERQTNEISRMASL